jgi:maltose-binding protein MalE
VIKMKRLSVLAVVALALAVIATAACGGGAAEPVAQTTPAASLGQGELSQLAASLEGKTIVLRWNGKPNGDKLLTYLAEVLTQQVKDVKIVKLWETDPTTAVSSDSDEVSAQITDKIAALAPDLVIASQCD